MEDELVISIFLSGEFSTWYYYTINAYIKVIEETKVHH